MPDSYGDFLSGGIRTMSDFIGNMIGGGFAPRSNEYRPGNFPSYVPIRTVPYSPNRSSSDPVSAALGQNFAQDGSFFPAVNQRLYADDRSDLNDMLGQSPETGFLKQGGGSPTPTPTPSAVKPTQMNLAQLMRHFGIAASGGEDKTETPVWQNKPDYQIYDWVKKLSS